MDYQVKVKRQSGNEEEYIVHYGVKGMRWGIRRNARTSYSDKVVKVETAKTNRRNARQQAKIDSANKRRLNTKSKSKLVNKYADVITKSDINNEQRKIDKNNAKLAENKRRARKSR